MKLNLLSRALLLAVALAAITPLTASAYGMAGAASMSTYTSSSGTMYTYYDASGKVIGTEWVPKSSPTGTSNLV